MLHMLHNSNMKTLCLKLTGAAADASMCLSACLFLLCAPSGDQGRLASPVLCCATI